MDKYVLAVKNLVEFILKKGSIDSRSSGVDRGLEGARIHRRIQRADADFFGKDYSAEVSLYIELPFQEFIYAIDGRMDALIIQNDTITIDEIKTTDSPIETINENFDPIHWAQVSCYGYIYCKLNNIQTIQLQLTYFQIDSETICRYVRKKTFEELEIFFMELLEKYHRWALMQHSWVLQRNLSIQSIPFPFDEFRAGQRKMAAAIYKTIQLEERLFCQAPTGIGKTISSLFPAIKSMGLGYVEKIFYLTAKTITRQAAEDAFILMRQKKLSLRSVTFTAKDKICFLEKRSCNPYECPFADHYYDRVNDIIFDLLQQHDDFSREMIESYARKYSLCPFELGMDLSIWCDAIICDYNYLFDPVVYLKRFFESHRNYIFLIDEAHNLPPRARDMYSAQISKQTILSVKKQFSKLFAPLGSSLKEVNSEMIALRKQVGEESFFYSKEPLEDLLVSLRLFAERCSAYFEINRNKEVPEELLKLYFEIRFYLKIADLYNDSYITLVSKSKSELTVKQICLDPSEFLDESLRKGRAAILFSATLSPIDYFISVLGGDTPTNEEKSPENKSKKRKIIPVKRCILPSPFEEKNLEILIANKISTKYLDRSSSLVTITKMISSFCGSHKGNYLVFFPSYSYMNQTYDVFTASFPQFKTLIQFGGMSETEREEFLMKFNTLQEDTLIGFCVLGGIYSEGIDLKGERLIGAVVVGVGLPQISIEQNFLRDYFDNKNSHGYQYAYQYPGMNKVLQAAGRVIRGADDYGALLLIDSRFTTSDYKKLFPPHWSRAKLVNDELQVSDLLAEFWERVKDNRL